jgi:creatinine amidohydrolase
MTTQLSELTRERIAAIAPDAVVVLPTASIEQHGPHLPLITDTALCGAVADRAAKNAAKEVPLLVAPVFWTGNSHHHFPFPGTLSLPSPRYIATVVDVLESLVRSGFRKLIILNGHGGNTDSNRVVALDMANRLDHPVRIAAAAYWDVARSSLVEEAGFDGRLIPGHAGRFETSLMMAIRPDLVDRAGLAGTRSLPEDQGLFSDFGGAVVHTRGAWQESVGYTDDPAAATPEEGRRLLEICVRCVAEFFTAFYKTTR